MANSTDPDQLASGSTLFALFAKAGYKIPGSAGQELITYAFDK